MRGQTAGLPPGGGPQPAPKSVWLLPLGRKLDERLRAAPPRVLELVGVVLLLVARNAGSFVTGAEVFVDGGFTGMRF